MRATLSVLALAAAAAAASAASVTGSRVLAILDSPAVARSHSLFLGQLKEAGFDVTTRVAGDGDVQLKAYNEYQFDHMVLLAPSAKNWNGVGVKDVMGFLAAGGNVLVATGPSVSANTRNLAAECGVHAQPAGHVLVDHVAYDAADGGRHTRVATGPATGPAGVLGADAPGAPLLWDGVGFTLDADNFLTFPILTAPPTGVSLPLDKPSKAALVGGPGLGLIVASQGRNNARAVFAGSMWALSDEAFLAPVDAANGAKAARGSNAEVAARVAEWAFHARGVLRASNIWHQHADSSPPAHQLSAKDKSTLPRSMYPYPEAAPQSLVYRIKEQVQYFVDLAVWDGAAWAPYDASDVQLEFVMLDPHLRQALTHQGNGTYKAQFLTPDVYGVFKFRLHYQRSGLTFLHEERQVTVRRFWHNEYERYILAAFPYYASAFSMMGGFFVFALVFLLARPGAVFKGGAAGKEKGE